MTTARVVTAVPLDAALRDRLGDCEITLVDFRAAGAAELDASLAAADGLLVNSYVTVDAAMFERAPQLRVVSTVSAGFDHIDLAVAAARGVAVTTAPVLSDAVADLTLALITMTARRLGEALDGMRAGEWRTRLLGTDLRGKRLCIVGFGRIGREVARRALAAKMRVCAFDVRAGLEPMAGVDMVGSLAEGLATADVVSLHVALNPSTQHLLDDAIFAEMKPGVIVINAARGGVIDQVALTRALLDGRVGAAGLDVLEQEPPDPDDPLLAMANVVMLPHIGSATHETRRAMLECAVHNLATVLRGEACEYALPLAPT